MKLFRFGPAGAGMGQYPPRYLQPGNVGELSISGLGEQRQVEAAG